MSALLDRLLALVPVDGRLDVRCELGPAWALDQAAAATHGIPFHALVAGQATVSAAGLDGVTMRAGDVLLLPAGGAHQLRGVAWADTAAAAADGVLLCGRFLVSPASARLLRAWLPPALLVRAAVGEAPSASRLQQLLALMRAETEDPADASPTVLRHLSAALFAVALRVAVGGAAPPASVMALGREPRLGALALAVLEAPGADWTLSAMAARAHMSRSSLLRAFEAAAGLSPAQFLSEVRMAEACRRLAQPRSSVAAVGEAVGYASEAAFQRAFKREMGQTPAEWRHAQAEAPADLPPDRPVRTRLA